MKKEIDVYIEERLSNLTHIKVKEQVALRKDMDIYGHDRLSYLTFRHTLK